MNAQHNLNIHLDKAERTPLDGTLSQSISTTATPAHNNNRNNDNKMSLRPPETMPSRGRRMKVVRSTSSSVYRTKHSGIILLNAAAALDGCDDQLLPASFRALEAELKFHPSLLGRVTLAQTMALSLSCPLWGYLADRYPRRKVMAVGIFSWGIATILLAFASKISHVILLRAVNGLFLGSIGPVSQSILADIIPDLSRGLQFGIVQMCASAGRIVGGVVTTSVSSIHIAGFYGWRWTFLAVGCLSLILGALVAIMPVTFNRPVRPVRSMRSLQTIEVYENQPPTPKQNQEHTTENEPPNASEDQLPSLQQNTEQQLSVFAFMKQVMSQSIMRPSVLLLVLEGIVGIIPWSALSFLTMYFQYSGLSDTLSGIVAGSLLLGAMISGPVGGLIGDRIHQWSPNHGRPFMGQLSMLARVPLLVIAFHLLPQDPSSFWAYLLVCFGIGLCSIAGVVVNRPLLSDVVRPNHRGTTFAVVVAIEGASGALFGAPGVGYLVEHVFGYIKTNELLSTVPLTVRQQNSYALSRALLCLTAVPWFLSFFIYGFIHLTYGPDRDKLQRQLMEEMETEGLEFNTSDRAPLVGIY